MKIKQYILYIYNWIYEKKIKISDKILKRKIGVPQILTIDETIDYIIKDNISVSRYGDGEMKIVSGERIRFQEYDVNLSEKLRKILKNNTQNLLVCVSDIYDDPKWMKNWAYEYTWKVVAKNRKDWSSYLNMDTIYGNAFITRCYMDWKNNERSEKWFSKLNKLFLLRENIVD